MHLDNGRSHNESNISLESNEEPHYAPSMQPLNVVVPTELSAMIKNSTLNRSLLAKVPATFLKTMEPPSCKLTLYNE
jgi:hypothetical protein